MERLQLGPSKLTGELSIPSSKSQSIRAIFLASLAEGKSQVRNVLSSPDTQAMVRACRAFGAQIEETKEGLEIKGVAARPRVPENVIDVGNSGLCLRFLGAMAGLCSQTTVITGDASIRSQRPVGDLIEGLRDLGVDAFSTRENDLAPLVVMGPMLPGNMKIEGRDSQPVSALLMLTAMLEGESTLKVSDPGEQPWVDLTLNWLERLDRRVIHQNHGFYRIWGEGPVAGFDYDVPGDLSTMAFPLVAALVTESELVVKNVDLDDPQGDKLILESLRLMGAEIEDRGDNCLKVTSGAHLRGIEVDMNPMIDALPILAVLGCFAEGKTVLKNAEIARSKECDRIASIFRELKKMGAIIEELPDGLSIEGSPLKGAELDSHGDHRIAMALAVAAMGAEGESSIQNSACIAKTFPGFVEDFQRLGAEIDRCVNVQQGSKIEQDSSQACPAGL